jgi:hypothetical protein
MAHSTIEKRRAYHRKRYKEKKDHIVFLTKKWVKENKDKRKTIQKKYRMSKKEKIKAYQKIYEKENRDKIRCRKHGITKDRYDALLTDQDGLCAVCKKPSPVSTVPFHIDHDHAHCPGQKSCGDCVRGLLCQNCNHGLGNFGDSIETLKSAILYLEKTKKVYEKD